MKDIYADDITLSIGPADKLVSYFESELAAAIADRPAPRPTGWTRLTATADPDVTAINAAFALALLERHDLVEPDHRLYDLARIAAGDAPRVNLGRFRHRFRNLVDDPGESEYRRLLVDAVQEYVIPDEPAAD